MTDRWILYPQFQSFNTCNRIVGRGKVCVWVHMLDLCWILLPAEEGNKSQTPLTAGSTHTHGHPWRKHRRLMFFWCCQSWLHYTAPKIKHTQTTATITLTFSSTDPFSKLSFINSPQCFSVNKQSFFQCLWSTSIAEKRLIYPLQPLPSHQEELLLGFNARFIRKSSSKCISKSKPNKNIFMLFGWMRACSLWFQGELQPYKAAYQRIWLQYVLKMKN